MVSGAGVLWKHVLLELLYERWDSSNSVAHCPF
jgi:hypothetical protein